MDRLPGATLETLMSRTSIALLLTFSGATLASGCVSTSPSDPGLGYRQDRFQEVQALRAFRDCRDQGLDLDRQARSGAEPARSIAGARVLERCESRLPAGSPLPEPAVRAQLLAVAALNRIRGGDIDGARAVLDRLRAGFPDHDLLFEDGASALDTLEVLSAGGPGTADVGGANLAAPVRHELARLRHWRSQ